MNLKSAAGVAAAVLLAFSAGWLWGASGKSSVEEQRRVLEERVDFESARAQLLEASVSVSLTNFGDARQHLDAALPIVQRAQTSLREVQQAERAGRLEVVLSDVREASRLAGRLDVSARGAIDQALQALALAER